MFKISVFLTSPPDNNLLYSSSYSPLWVIISIALGILASYVALKITALIEKEQRHVFRLTWAIITSLILGLGFWTMHFVGMLALSLPCKVGYEPFITVLSIIPGIMGAGFALCIVFQLKEHLSRLVRSILLATGIGTMHYTGMMAMQLEGFVRYDPFLFVISLIVALLLSYLALNLVERLKIYHKIGGAIGLGMAVSGTHYSAMASTYFVSGDINLLPDTLFTPNTLAIIITLSCIFLAFGALALVMVLRNFEITEQLRSSEERWKFALEGSGDGVWDWNPQTDKVFFSKYWKEMLGFEEHEFIDTGTAFIELLHPDDKNSVQKTIESYFKDKLPIFVIEFRMQTKNGSWKWILSRGKIVERDANCKPVRFLGTLTDITERKLIEEKLRIAATAFESQEAMMITDANKIIIQVNQAFTKNTGYDAEEAIGQTPKLLRSGRHDSAFYKQMWDSINNTGGWQGEIWDRRKNGEEYPKWLTISRVKNEFDEVTHYVGTHYDITERKKAEEQIRQLAFFDQLTGLPNRTLFLDRLKQQVNNSARNEHYSAIVMIDLDNFKVINDTLGHNMGDLYLKQVALQLKSAMRDSDTIARLGGDEFMVILVDLATNLQDAANASEKVAENIQRVINQSYTLGDISHQGSASIGVSVFNGKITQIDDLMKQADLAMYKSKASGRNTIRFFDPEMESSVMERSALEKDLHKAIEEKQFELYYQSQVNDKGIITGAEVLIRWNHPQQGMISPAKFIPLAEETGQIIPLGQWIMETACKQLAVWARQPEMSSLTLAVNVSARQFAQDDFVEKILNTLQNSNANPKQLKLELTESLLVQNIKSVIKKMSALKVIGISFSLDDFGTGYSSLTYLKRLPLEQLKIDQSFVRDILEDPNDAAISSTIIALANSLGLNVIAEGVETDLQKEFLGKSGCYHYQGYLFSRPLPLDDFEAYLLKV